MPGAPSAEAYVSRATSFSPLANMNGSGADPVAPKSPARSSRKLSDGFSSEVCAAMPCH